MMLKNTRYIGNNRFESECLRCGGRIVWQQSDGVVFEVDEAGHTGLLCPRCYDGPAESTDKLEELRREPDGAGWDEPDDVPSDG